MGNNPSLPTLVYTYLLDHVNPLPGNHSKISGDVHHELLHTLFDALSFSSKCCHNASSHFFKFFYVYKPTSFHTLTSLCQHLRCVWRCFFDKVEDSQIMSSKTLPFYSTSLQGSWHIQLLLIPTDKSFISPNPLSWPKTPLSKPESSNPSISLSDLYFLLNYNSTTQQMPPKYLARWVHSFVEWGKTSILKLFIFFICYSNSYNREITIFKKCLTILKNSKTIDLLTS